MEAVLQSLMSGLPILLLHVAVTLAMLAAAVALYVRITPYDEIKLIRDGNVAASVSLGAAILGLGLPLAFTLAGSINVWDIVVWGDVVLLVQLLAYKAGDLILRDLPRRIEDGEIGPALVLAAIKLAVAENPRRPAPQAPSGDLWESETGAWMRPEVGGRQPDMEPDDKVLFNGVVEAKPKDHSSTGTAFAIDRAGLWLTARHVSEGCNEILLQVGRRKGLGARTLVEHPRADVGLLQTRGASRPLPLARVIAGSTRDAHMFGFPKGSPGAVHGRLIGTARTRHTGIWNFSERVSAWTEISRVPDRSGSLGSISGGAVLDPMGRVIGVVQSEFRRRGRVMTALPSTLWDTIGKARHDIAAAEEAAKPVPELTPDDYPRYARRLIRGLRVAKVWCKV